MTDHEKRIREALEGHLTGEAWEREPFEVDVYAVDGVLVASAYDHDDAAFIAACNPSAIRALLADLDAVRVKAARYDWLRDEAVLFGHDDGSPSAWVVVGTGYKDCDPIEGSELDATIDAALKGASHD